MNKLSKIPSFSIKLLIGLLLLATMVIGTLNYLSFHTTRNTLSDVTQSSVTALLDNSERNFKITEFFTDFQNLKFSFLGDAQKLEVESTRLTQEWASLLSEKKSTLSAEQLNRPEDSLSTILKSFHEINRYHFKIQKTYDQLHSLLANLEETIGDSLVQETLQGQDTAFLEQILILIVGYHQSLLEIDRLLSDLEVRYLNEKIIDPEKLYTLIDDLILRLHTITASAPFIAEKGEKLIQESLKYREDIEEYINLFKNLWNQTENLEEIKEQFQNEVVMSERNMAIAFKQMQLDVSKTISLANFILFTLTILVFVIFGLIIVFLFRKMDQEIQYRKKLETQLVHFQKMEAIGTLAGGIAHEFNNMLAVISGNNDLLLDELPEGNPLREFSGEIKTAGLRAKDVVDQLLTFSRRDSTIHDVIDLGSEVQSSIKLIRSSTPANIAISYTPSEGSYFIFGNATQINQVLINICNNAFDALPDTGGKVTIELTMETLHKEIVSQKLNSISGQYAKIVVSDNGEGMEPETVKRIFDPYYTTKDFGEGTGLGMAIVHGIVESHNGKISVQSVPGSGTEVSILLPLYEGEKKPTTAIHNILPLGDEHILFVDDEPAIARLAKQLLESLGYTVESTTEPLKALEIIKHKADKIDLLITDMAMPRLTGDQLIAEISKINDAIPVIVCTGYNKKISQGKTAAMGAQAHILKPFDKSDLAKIVRKVLEDSKIRL